MKILSVNLGSTSSVTSKTKDNVSLLYSKFKFSDKN